MSNEVTDLNWIHKLPTPVSWWLFFTFLKFIYPLYCIKTATSQVKPDSIKGEIHSSHLQQACLPDLSGKKTMKQRKQDLFFHWYWIHWNQNLVTESGRKTDNVTNINQHNQENSNFIGFPLLKIMYCFAGWWEELSNTNILLQFLLIASIYKLKFKCKFKYKQ